MTDSSTRESSSSLLSPPTRSQLDRLAAVLVPGGSPSTGRRLPGGISCTMDLFTVSVPGGRLRRFVLRRHRAGESSAASPIPREAHALRLARTAGVSVPAVVWTDEEGLFAEPALVLSFIEGEPPDGSVDTDGRADQMAEALVTIHSARIEARDHEMLEQYVPGRGDDGVTVPDPLAAHPLGSPLLNRIRRLRSSLVDVEACFLHADFHPGNTLWSGDDLVAVVDWEIAGVGDPAFDVAYCATDIRYLGLGSCADRFIATYRRLSGRALPNLTYWTAIALARAMPDLGAWLPAFATMDEGVTASVLRRRHTDLVEELLAG